MTEDEAEDEHEKPLLDAVESLQSAEELVEGGDIEDQLYKESEALSELAGRDRAPDQRRIRGHHYTLKELHNKTSGDARKHLQDALHGLKPLHDPIGEGV